MMGKYLITSVAFPNGSPRSAFRSDITAWLTSFETAQDTYAQEFFVGAVA
jgi:hypothetical protein